MKMDGHWFILVPYLSFNEYYFQWIKIDICKSSIGSKISQYKKLLLSELQNIYYIYLLPQWFNIYSASFKHGSN